MEEEGLVKSVKYKGAFVMDINTSEIYPMYLLRAEIEANVIGLILHKLTKKHLGELYDIVERMKTKNGYQDYASLSEIDMDFHWKIVQWSDIEVPSRACKGIIRI